MHFHDNKGMMDKWHDYWEACGCEPQARGGVLPRPLDSRHVSALLYMQWARGMGREVISPLDDWGKELVEMSEGKAKGGSVYDRLLEGLEGVEVRWVSIKLWTPLERAAVAKWVRIEEYLQERGRLRREKARLAKKRKEIYRERMERIRGGNKRRGGRVLASVEELEGRAMECERAVVRGEGRMASMRAAKYWNQAEIRRKEIEMARKKGGEIEGVKGIKEDGGLELERVESVRPEVELEVIRVGPNPRILVCRYKILAEELLVKLKVHSTLKFVKGMRIRMREEEGEEWEYTGNLPRHKGRW
jgi:hypothetical protein